MSRNENERRMRIASKRGNVAMTDDKAAMGGSLCPICGFYKFSCGHTAAQRGEGGVDLVGRLNCLAGIAPDNPVTLLNPVARRLIKEASAAIAALSPRTEATCYACGAKRATGAKG